MSEQSKLRIESHQDVVTSPHVYYILDPDDPLYKKANRGTEEDSDLVFLPVDEIDISDCLTRIDVHLQVGEASRATLHAILVESDLTVYQDEAIVRRIRPGKSRWSWLPRRKPKTIDATRFGGTAKTYVTGLETLEKGKRWWPR